jgi:tetratricopeptide (TPR) repeat protein
MTDLTALWDFSDAAGSEARFRAAADWTNGADRAVLLTQVARALGLQDRFEDGHTLLDTVAAEASDDEVVVRIALERGRLWNTAGEAGTALASFHRAAELAGAARLAGLRLDALHMAAIAAPPEERARLNREALEEARSSEDPAGRRWEASLLNNLGMALVDSGELEEAHEAFADAVAARERDNDVTGARVGRWMVGWVLRLRGRHDEALAVQRSLHAELTAAGEHDPYVEEELALLEASTEAEGTD